MSELIKAMQLNNATGLTANGAITHATSHSDCVDLFAIVGSSRGKDIIHLFEKAIEEDQEVAVRILQFARDIRGGAGERQTFRDLFAYLIEYRLHLAKRLLVKIPEIGRWDDVLVAIDTPLEVEAIELVRAGLSSESSSSLAAKWMPRQGKAAYKLRKAFSMTPKGWRKMVVTLSNTVEQKMCAKKWHEIEYSKLPSKAAANYQNAFKRNDSNRYDKYVEGLEAGTEKINAGAIFPQDVVVSAKKGNDKVATAQWKALPNYMEDTTERILPLIDVSYSMQCPVGGSTSLNCMDVAVALGLYTAERMGGMFKDHFITFHTVPQLLKVQGNSLLARVRTVESSNWGGSTNFQSAMNLILKAAIQNSLTQEDMPTMLLVLSDMEFNQASSTRTNFREVKENFEFAGYKLPKIVFWNLNAREGNSPATVHDKNVTMVSGFSPAVLKSVLSGRTVSPVDVMLEAVMLPRYGF